MDDSGPATTQWNDPVLQLMAKVRPHGLVSDLLILQVRVVVIQGDRGDLQHS